MSILKKLNIQGIAIYLVYFRFLPVFDTRFIYF